MPLTQPFKERTTYFDKLKTPEWESFRSGFISRNGAACTSCKRSGVSTQVHHLAYERDRDPWEYADNELIVLCQGCHKQWHKLINIFRVTVGRASVNELQMLVATLAFLCKEHRTRDVAFAVAQLAAEPDTFRRLRIVWERS